MLPFVLLTPPAVTLLFPFPFLFSQRVATGAATATVAAMAQAPAALAEVAPRMNGDGTGLILGVNEPILGWILISVFGLVWALYATSVKGISNNDDEDSGLFL